MQSVFSPVSWFLVLQRQECWRSEALNHSSPSDSLQWWKHLRFQNSPRKYDVFWRRSDLCLVRREVPDHCHVLWRFSEKVSCRKPDCTSACLRVGQNLHLDNADRAPLTFQAGYFFRCSERCLAPESLPEQRLTSFSSAFVSALAQGYLDARYRNIAFFLFCNQCSGVFLVQLVCKSLL